MAQVVGIDLGTSTVKLTVLEGTFKRRSAVNHRVRAVPQDGSAVPNLAARLAVLGQMLDEEPLETSVEVAAAYPADRSSFRTITLPFVDRTQVAKTLPFEMENHVAFDLDDMVLDYRIVSAVEGRSTILAGLADKRHVAELVDGLHAEGADPKNMPFDADLLSAYGADGTVAVIDIGHSRTLVTVVREGATWAVRALDGGGRDITLRLMRAFNLDYTAAEALKRVSVVTGSSAGVAATPVAATEWAEDDRTNPESLEPETDAALEAFEEPPQQQEESQLETETLQPESDTAPVGEADPAAVASVIEETLQALLSEIRATLIAFEDLLGVGIDEVLLAGGTSLLQGITGLISDGLGVPVRHVVLPLPEESSAKDGSPEYALSLALGLRAAGDLPARFLELRKGRFIYKGRVRTLQNLLLLGATLVVLVVVGALGSFAWKHHTIAKRITETDAAIVKAVTTTFPDVLPAQVATPALAVAVMQERVEETTSRVDTLGEAMLGQPPELTLMKELSEAMPPPNEARVDVRELNIADAAMSFLAETDGYEAAAKIEAALQKFPKFSRAAKGEEKKVGEGVSFSVTIPLGDADSAAESKELPEAKAKESKVGKVSKEVPAAHGSKSGEN
jgi:Tfp pilus assembly PilM family ATPase